MASGFDAQTQRLLADWCLEITGRRFETYEREFGRALQSALKALRIPDGQHLRVMLKRDPRGSKPVQVRALISRVFHIERLLAELRMKLLRLKSPPIQIETYLKVDPFDYVFGICEVADGNEFWGRAPKDLGLLEDEIVGLLNWSGTVDELDARVLAAGLGLGGLPIRHASEGPDAMEFLGGSTGQTRKRGSHRGQP